MKGNLAVVSMLLIPPYRENSFTSSTKTKAMKKIPAIIIVLLSVSFTARAQYDKCAPSVSLITFYYTAEAHTKYGFGFEAGMQGVDSRVGYFAGIQFQKMTDNYFVKDTASFRLRAGFYLKGTYRINEDPCGKGSIFLVGSTGLSVQTGFDFKPGLRFVLPLSEKKALGVEPSYSLNYKTVSLNVLVIL
jgi:hypothetical protein